MDYSKSIPLFNLAAEKAEEFEQVQRELNAIDPSKEQGKAKALGKKYSQLAKIAAAFEVAKKYVDDIDAAGELAKEDASFAGEVEMLAGVLEHANAGLEELLILADPDDTKNVIMEIKAGSGGEESALFAEVLFRMYSKFADSKGWKVAIHDLSETGIGGYKNVEFTVSGSQGCWGELKFEGGVHRVQRVPVTESSGRIHTSAAGVYVFPEVEDEEEIEIDEAEIRVDVFRSSGPGGQSVNTTDSAVRITHVPSGIVVSMQNEKSQIQNRAAAMRVLKSRLLALRNEENEKKEADARKLQVRTADRSERIRTYNYPENRISDHRTGYKAYNLDAVLEGNLQPIIDSYKHLPQNG